VVLFCAAGLKSHQLLTEPSPERGLEGPRWFRLGLVEVELWSGLWLLAGLRPHMTWRLALAGFSCFAGVALFKAWAGEASCGCFGRVSVHPWYVLAVDAAAVGGLLMCRPVAGHRGPSRNPARLAILLLAAPVGLGVAVGALRFNPGKVTPDGDVVGNGKVVLLEPETWIGRRFPLLGGDVIGLPGRSWPG
jgi:hypothetical protein